MTSASKKFKGKKQANKIVFFYNQHGAQFQELSLLLLRCDGPVQAIYEMQWRFGCPLLNNIPEMRTLRRQHAAASAGNSPCNTQWKWIGEICENHYIFKVWFLKCSKIRVFFRNYLSNIQRTWTSFSNIERTRTCSSIDGRTRTPEFWLWKNGHRTQKAFTKFTYSSNRLEYHFFEHWTEL